MSLFWQLGFATLVVAFQYNWMADSCRADATLPPLQTLNFEFAPFSYSGLPYPGYHGDDGVLSSPGGTYWNVITPVDITNGCCGSYPSTRDEFGMPSEGFIYPSPGFVYGSPFSGEYFQNNWFETFAARVNEGPRADGLYPFSTVPSYPNSPVAILTIGRVFAFEEMVIYVNSPIGSSGTSSDFGGGFSVWPLSIEIAEPFPFASGAGTAFPGTEGNEYLRITSPPPLAPGLGYSPTLTIVLEGNSSISAIQIRGRFRGLPEPSSIILLLGGATLLWLRRATK